MVLRLISVPVIVGRRLIPTVSRVNLKAEDNPSVAHYQPVSPTSEAQLWITEGTLLQLA